MTNREDDTKVISYRSNLIIDSHKAQDDICIRNDARPLEQGYCMAPFTFNYFNGIHVDNETHQELKGIVGFEVVNQTGTWGHEQSMISNLEKSGVTSNRSVSFDFFNDTDGKSYSYLTVGGFNHTWTFGGKHGLIKYRMEQNQKIWSVKTQGGRLGVHNFSALSRPGAMSADAAISTASSYISLPKDDFWNLLDLFQDLHTEFHLNENDLMYHSRKCNELNLPNLTLNIGNKVNTP